MIRSVQQHLAAHLPKGDCAVAVSGGGDSVALLLLLVQEGLKPLVLHYNHGLRKESAEEQLFVEALAKSLGCDFSTGIWESPSKEGNTQQLARNMRYSFFEQEMKAKAIQHLFVAHTEGDLMETFFLRLSKGSSVAGLPGLKAVSCREAYTLHRPLLNVSRQQLRDYLTQQQQRWYDDPTNEDEHYWRPRFRKLSAEFESLGLTAVALKGFFESAERINDYFDAQVEDFLQNSAEIYEDKIILSLENLAPLHEELRYRLYNKVCQSLFSISALRKSTKESLDKLLTQSTKVSVAHGFAESKKGKITFYL